MKIKDEQLSLFQSNELKLEVNGVRAVNAVDLSTLRMPFDGTPGQFIDMKDYVEPGEFIMYSSGAYHYFYTSGVIQARPGLLPDYFSQPVFPWIKSIYNHSGKIRSPGVPQAKAPYPYVSLGKKNKKLYTHILAANAFIPRPDDPEYCLVSHKNDMKWDYSLRNLFWNTNKGNSVGFKKERRMNPLEIFDKWWNEFTRGVEYNVEDWQVEEDGF